eukprot:752957-Amphidinium_carterae.1
MNKSSFQGFFLLEKALHTSVSSRRIATHIVIGLVGLQFEGFGLTSTQAASTSPSEQAGLL